eukprot:scaffold1768_cov194-Prasinococcus_capsulatus_cf.AAC.6
MGTIRSTAARSQVGLAAYRAARLLPGAGLARCFARLARGPAAAKRALRDGLSAHRVRGLTRRSAVAPGLSRGRRRRGADGRRVGALEGHGLAGRGPRDGLPRRRLHQPGEPHLLRCACGADERGRARRRRSRADAEECGCVWLQRWRCQARTTRWSFCGCCARQTGSGVTGSTPSPSQVPPPCRRRVAASLVGAVVVGVRFCRWTVGSGRRLTGPGLAWGRWQG